MIPVRPQRYLALRPVTFHRHSFFQDGHRGGPLCTLVPASQERVLVYLDASG